MSLPITGNRRKSDGPISESSNILRTGSNSTYQEPSQTFEVSSFDSSPELHNYRVEFSDAYRVAYELFSPLTDKQWMTRLQAIVSQAAVGDPSWTDMIGVTQSYQKRRLEAYNSAIAAIQNLINDYYDWKNTLPVTQVQQAADAGVNLAVTGGIQSSELTSSESLMSDLSGEGVDSTNFLTGAIGAVSGIMSTVASVYKSVSDVKLARDQFGLSRTQRDDNVKSFLANYWKSLSDSGFDVGEKSFQSFDDLASWFSTNQSDPEIISRSTEALRKQIKSQASFYPLERYFIDENGDFVVDINRLLYESVGADSMKDFDETMNLFAQYEMQTMLLNKLDEFNTAVYKENYSANLDGTEQALSENAVASMNAAAADLNELRDTINSEFIQSFADEWHKAKSPESKFALLRMISGLNLDDQSAMELVRLLGSPTLAKGSDQVISKLIDVGGNFANKLSLLFGKRKPESTDSNIPRKRK